MFVASSISNSLHKHFRFFACTPDYKSVIENHISLYSTLKQAVIIIFIFIQTIFLCFFFFIKFFIKIPFSFQIINCLQYTTTNGNDQERNFRKTKTICVQTSNVQLEHKCQISICFLLFVLLPTEKVALLSLTAMTDRSHICIKIISAEKFTRDEMSKICIRVSTSHQLKFPSKCFRNLIVEQLPGAK